MDSNGNIIIIKKKSRYSGLQKQLKSLENRFDILDDDLYELKREIDDIKNKLSDTKCPASQKSKSKTKHNTSSDSSGSD